VGFDKRVEAETVKRMRNLAEKLVPEIAHSKIHESWAGLRPGTSDDLPIIGETSMPGYFIATGHFRNGILLAPVTAEIMARLLRREAAGHSIEPFSPARFA
jgi:glycine oxidase